MTIAIRGGTELPAFREDIELTTADGLTLVGELALQGIVLVGALLLNVVALRLERVQMQAE